jgi:hypothetical protein
MPRIFAASRGENSFGGSINLKPLANYYYADRSGPSISILSMVRPAGEDLAALQKGDSP